MTTVEILKAAKELISDPKRWTQGLFARNIEGLVSPVTSKDAVCWCAAGSLWRVDGPSPTIQSQREAAYELLSNAMGGSVPDYNDTHTHIEVLAKFDEAIALAEEEERCAVS